jgi:puromycin-sensitive aminopeptidase
MPNENAQATLEKDMSYRLPREIYPLKYEIALEPDLANFSFSGEETVLVQIDQPGDTILLNAVDISFEHAHIESRDGSQKFEAKVELTAATERAALTFPQALHAGEWLLHISFKGEINDKLRGFYRSAQALQNGEKSWLAVTQFEATDARRAFPCFDEPAFKATFKLTLTVDNDLTALSNTPVESERTEGAKKIITFKETMKMSTYIVAFVVGQLEASEPVMVDGIPLRIYAPLGKLHLTAFAKEIGAAALSFFNGYYGIKYPGEKMDMIAVPDFAFGAMENLGAVIYRENALLVDPNQASHGELERVADVVAHELAHMWFGNLTTMKWWNGIWLNEAFATFMELVAVDNWKPQWKRWETFGVSRAMAFATDGLKATRPIEFPVNAPEEANGMFDILTYEKGASVLRMLEQYIGPDKFKSGVNNYLNLHKFSNTETVDLWNALGQASGEPVADIMNSWIFQEGHPLVHCDIDDKESTLTLTQKRFYYQESESATLYQVPVLLRAKTKEGIVEKRLLLNSQTATVNFASPVQWVVVNSGGSGFYRVNYSPKLLTALKAVLTQSFHSEGSADREKLSTLERFNFVSDLWALTVNGAVELGTFLDTIKLFKEERDKNVWTTIATALQYTDRVFYQDNGTLAALTSGILGPTIERLGWQPEAGESELTKQLRGLVLTLQGTIGKDVKIQAEAKARYQKHLDGAETLSPDVASAVVAILAHCGDKARYEQFEESFKKATSPQEQERFMYALGMFSQQELLQRTLEKTLTGEVRSQNAPYLVRNIMLNHHGRHAGWKFMTDNWEVINRTFPSLIITRLVEGITGLVDDELAEEVFNFFAGRHFAGGQKTVDQHLEKLQVALRFMHREKL